MRRLGLLIAPLVLFLAVAGGCGDNGSTVDPGSTVVSPVETVPVFDEETPTSLDALKGELTERLEGYGVNIGAVPNDVRQHLLNLCGQLETFVDSGAVEEICSAIDDAIEQNDPELMDAILESLSALEAD